MFTADDQAQLKVMLKVTHFCFFTNFYNISFDFQVDRRPTIEPSLKYLSPAQKEMRKCIQTARHQRNFKMARADDAEFAAKQREYIHQHRKR